MLSGTTLGPATTLSASSASYPNASGPTVSVDAAGGVTLAWVRRSGSVLLGDSRLEARTRPSATGNLSATRAVAGNGNDSIEGFRLDRVGASIFAFSGFISDPSGPLSGQLERVLQSNGTFTDTVSYAPTFIG